MKEIHITLNYKGFQEYSLTRHLFKLRLEDLAWTSTDSTAERILSRG